MAEVTTGEIALETCMTEVRNLLEAEPSMGGSTPMAGNIPSLRKQLAVLVTTSKTKEAIGVQLTHEQVKRLSEYFYRNCAS